ncbi:MAG: DUF192 domain-containing protein [Bdellovibrionales bacterium]
MRLSASDKTLLENLEVADTMWTRNKGLLGRAKLNPGQGLWILRCNAIHTFFMKFAIDLVFVNKKMVVVKTISRVSPGRITLPVWRASSVFELEAGFLEKHPLKVGEKLNVDSTLS